MNKNILARLETLERKKPGKIRVIIRDKKGETITVNVADFMGVYLPQGWQWVAVESGNDKDDIRTLLDASVLQSFRDPAEGVQALEKIRDCFEGGGVPGGREPQKTAENKGVKT